MTAMRAHGQVCLCFGRWALGPQDFEVFTFAFRAYPLGVYFALDSPVVIDSSRGPLVLRQIREGKPGFLPFLVHFFPPHPWPRRSFKASLAAHGGYHLRDGGLVVDWAGLLSAPPHDIGGELVDALRLMTRTLEHVPSIAGWAGDKPVEILKTPKMPRTRRLPRKLARLLHRDRDSVKAP